MSYYTGLKGPAYTAMLKAVDKMRTQAMTEGKIPASELIVRSLRPQDMSLTNPDWSFNVASGSAWNTVVDNQIVADLTWFCICGFGEKEGTPLVSEIEVTRRGKVARKWHPQMVDTLHNKHVFVDDVITLGQNEKYTVKMYEFTSGTNSTYEMPFFGVVVEKRGLIVA